MKNEAGTWRLLARHANVILGSAAPLGVHARKQADVRELLVLAPFTIVGLALGVTLLVRLGCSSSAARR
jgi:uncharacterized membrane protein YfcA